MPLAGQNTSGAIYIYRPYSLNRAEYIATIVIGRHYALSRQNTSGTIYIYRPYSLNRAEYIATIVIGPTLCP